MLINKSQIKNVLNKNIFGKENVIFIRESMSNSDMYEVHIYAIGSPYKYLYANGKSSAEAVIKVAKRFNINLI